MEILKNIQLKNFNTFGIEANAEYFTEIFSESELEELIKTSVFKKNKRLILGGGSNILLTGDFKGLVIKLNLPGINILNDSPEKTILEAGAGVLWNDVVELSVNKNLGGIENLSLIPGTAGAAPMQNIGAYGQEIKNVFYNLEGYSTADGHKELFTSDMCKFGYRDSIFKHELKNGFIITKIRLALNNNPEPDISYNAVRSEIEKLGIDKVTIKDVSKAICKIRREKLPDPSIVGNAGSFFKNPIIRRKELKFIQRNFPGVAYFDTGENTVKLAAAWLIENAGWKGKRIGKAGTHVNQPLVLVNYGGATGKEILSLSDEIKKTVKEKFDVTLKEEVNIF